MAATVSIVVKAINATKAVFQEVGNQAEMLNKRINLMGKFFKGLFVAGLAARFVKSLAEASSYSDKLSAGAEKARQSWRTVAEDLGDALAPVFTFFLDQADKVAQGFTSLINQIRFAGAYWAALLETGSNREALKVAEETVAQLESEQAARRELIALQQDLKTQAEETEKYKQKLAEETYDLEQKLEDEKVKLQESRMTDEELLAKRRMQLEEKRKSLQKQISVGSDEELNKLLNRKMKFETEIDIVNIQEEIDRLEKAIAKATKPEDEKRRAGVRRIIFNRRDREFGVGAINFGTSDQMMRESADRMGKLNKVDASWQSANYLKEIKDKINEVLALKD